MNVLCSPICILSLITKDWHTQAVLHSAVSAAAWCVSPAACRHCVTAWVWQ